MRNRFCIILLSFLFVSAGYVRAQESAKLTVRQVGSEADAVEKPERNFRFTAGGGYAYRLGKMEKTGNKELDDFSSSLRNGYNLDLEAQYFLHEHWGLAMNANYIMQSKEELGVLGISSVSSIPGYKESNRFIYVGPSFVARFENNNFGFYMSAGFGPLFYTNRGEVMGRQLEISKTVFGSYVGLAGEYRINQSIGAGLKLSATTGTVNMPELGSSDEKQNVSNLMITAFISFRTK